MTHSIHDRTMQQVFNIPSFFKGFLKTYLPQDVKDVLDFKNLKTIPPVISLLYY